MTRLKFAGGVTGTASSVAFDRPYVIGAMLGSKPSTIHVAFRFYIDLILESLNGTLPMGLIQRYKSVT